MKCINPVLLKRSGQYVPCQKCNFCLLNRRIDWTFRINQELKVAHSAVFLTLTYDGLLINQRTKFKKTGMDDVAKYVPYFGVRKVYPYEFHLVKEHLRDFLKRLRKVTEPIKLRYFAVGEYGEDFERPHFHCIMMNVPVIIMPQFESIWGYGFANVREVTPGRVHYITKYVINKAKDYGGRAPPFAVMSRRPGLGSNYLDTHTRWHKLGQRNYVEVNGYKGRIPRFYKERMFSKLERERLASEAVEMEQEDYWKEIERLEAYHPDPFSYYDERISFMYSQMDEAVIKHKNQRRK